MIKKTRILICDDHTLFVEGIKAMLRNESSLEIVGEARDGRQAVELVKELKPDLLLMDVSMPDMNGFDATQRVHELDPNIKVLILTMHDEEELVARCLEAGAAGYIIKDAPASQLLYAIEMVKKGERYLSPVVLKQVVAGYVKNSNVPQTSYDRLSPREREVLKLLAEGLSVKEIATRLNLSVKTVDVHKTNLMKKIDVHDRTELIKYAIRQKLIAV
ncbi:MAG TPA: response regulator transcription factor [Terriglobia bacterium]|nr:response regulator transcription factor [Terriglobia bacterium]